MAPTAGDAMVRRIAGPFATTFLDPFKTASGDGIALALNGHDRLQEFNLGESRRTLSGETTWRCPFRRSAAPKATKHIDVKLAQNVLSAK